MIGSVPCVRKVAGWNPALAATQALNTSSSPTMLCIIASAPPRGESALLSLASRRKNGYNFYQRSVVLYCIDNEVRKHGRTCPIIRLL